MKRYAHVFAISGNSTFPVDMLRYDNCRPLHEGDSATIEASFTKAGDGKRRVVYVRTINNVRTWQPTVGRWKSLGWRVDLDSIAVAELP